MPQEAAVLGSGAGIRFLFGSVETAQKDREGGLDVAQRGGEGGLELGGCGGAVKDDDLQAVKF